MFFVFNDLLLCISFKCRDLVSEMCSFLLLPEQPDPVMQPPVTCQCHVKESLPEARDDTRRPGSVSAEVHPDQDHARRDLRSVGSPTFFPVSCAHVLHHGSEGQFVLTLNVGANVRPKFAGSLVLQTIKDYFRLYFKILTLRINLVNLFTNFKISLNNIKLEKR